MRIKKMSLLAAAMMMALGGAALADDPKPAPKPAVKKPVAKKGPARKTPAKKPAPAKPAPKADNKAIGSLMGEFKFGMEPKEVIDLLAKKIDERYAEQIATTTDVYRQDQLRKKASAERSKLQKGYLKFAGKKTGWDVSIIDKEFAHHNDESMLVYWERDPESGKDQRRFFFFVDDKLYKMFIAFNQSMFGDDKGFAYFQQAMEKKFGKGELVFEDNKYGEQTIKHLFWRDDTYALRAINLLDFYGSFCLAISDAKVEKWLGERRTERSPQVKRDTAIIDAVTEKGDEKPSLDEGNSSVVDRIVKKPQ